MGLDGVELVMAYEEEFQIKIPPPDAEAMGTPKEVIDYIAKCLRARGEHPDRSQIAETVKQITLEQLGLKPEDYWEEARYIEDLGTG
jgi:acyl carrier protein